MASEQGQNGKTHELMIFAELFQIYVHDEQSEADLSDAWDEDAEMCMIAVANNILGVRTQRDMDVAVIVEIASGEPEEDDLAEWDHVAQASIDVPSGRLVVSGPTEDYDMAQRIDIAPGRYIVRVYFGMLEEVDEEGFEGDDFYKLVLWRGEPKPVKVLKQWVPEPVARR